MHSFSTTYKKVADKALEFSQKKVHLHKPEGKFCV